MSEREFSPEEIAKFEKQRALEIAELIKGGAESVAEVAHPPDPNNPNAKNPQRRWEINANQMAVLHSEGLGAAPDKIKSAQPESKAQPETRPEPKEQAKDPAPEKLKNPEKSPETEVKEKIAELCSRFEAAYAEWLKFQPELQQSRPDLYNYTETRSLHKTNDIFKLMQAADISSKEILWSNYTFQGFSGNAFHELYQLEQILSACPSEDPIWRRTLEHVEKMTEVVDGLLDYVDTKIYKDGIFLPPRPQDQRAHVPMNKELRNLPELKNEIRRRVDANGGHLDNVVVATQGFIPTHGSDEEIFNYVHLYSPRDWA